MALGRGVEVDEERRRHPVLRVLLTLLFLFLLIVAGAVVTGGVWLKHKMQSAHAWTKRAGDGAAGSAWRSAY
jgi:hypothetical protein